MPSSSTDELLFVYGTLRKDSNHPMHHLLARNSTYFGEGRVRGEMYDLGRYPGIVLNAGSPEFAHGEVYGIKSDHASETLRILDDYEGCGPENPEPHEYIRQRVPVILVGGKGVVAWAYVLGTLPKGAARVPTGDYLAWVRRSREKAEANRFESEPPMKATLN